MPRSRKSTRRTPRSNPHGVIDIRMGGYGFVKTNEGEFFVPVGKTGSAFDGDMVEIVPMPDRRKSQQGKACSRAKGHAGGVSHKDEKRVARVVRVLSRAHETIIGRYEIAEPFGVVVPEDPRIKHDIFTRRADNLDVPDGSLVKVRITAFPSRDAAATGVIEEVLGDADTGDFGVDLIVSRHKLETEFSAAARNQAKCAALDIQGALASGYRDIRNRVVFTIDPADARDFDDALSLSRVEGMWCIGIHIADVSHYVPWESSIDMDARRRATSVYLVDRVIPMLPEELSNELCSLKPGEVRRSMTVDLYVNDDAHLIRYEIYPALMQSDARFTYSQVQEQLECYTGSFAAPQFLQGVRDDTARSLCRLSDFAKKRARARKEAGGLDFDTREAKVRLDEDGHAVGIDIREKTDATQLVEEMMIWANEVVARYLLEHDHPCMYRVHGQPVADALGSLLPIMQEFDWFTAADEHPFLAGDPHAVSKVLEASHGRPEGELVSNLVLRAMQRAIYSPFCDGHYGLASTAYCHFTSPIRRYPDLVVHRMLKDLLTREGKMPFVSEQQGQVLEDTQGHAQVHTQGHVHDAADGVVDDSVRMDSGTERQRPARNRAKGNAFARQCAQLKFLSEHSSEMERVADAAARESQEYKMVEYLQDYVGQRFGAVVSGVATYGIYVRLENTAEGMVPIRDIGDEYFVLDPSRYILTGADTGKQIRLGSRIAVVLREADPRTRTLRFTLVNRTK